MPDRADKPKRTGPRLVQIANAFARYANFTLGGGSATVAVLHRELMDKRKWISNDDFSLCFGLARLTPGTNLLAFCTGVGWLLRGMAGAMIALLAASIPCAVFVVAATAMFSRWQENTCGAGGHPRGHRGGRRHYRQNLLDDCPPSLQNRCPSPGDPNRGRSVPPLCLGPAASHRGIANRRRGRCTAAGSAPMNVAVLYLLLLKGTVTAFAGLASLPVIQDELVIQRHVLTDTQLNEAVVITRSTPGPVGLYIVSVGYFVAGVPGALAGWLAMITPALLIIPLVHFVGHRMEHPRIKSFCRRSLLPAPVCCSQRRYRLHATRSLAGSRWRLQPSALSCCSQPSWTRSGLSSARQYARGRRLHSAC